jgi:ABC-type Fe3+-hydroxamate transport system substrate-binding protein
VGRTRRVVSLVPSATETLRALGVEPVACTRFCEQPDLPTVGGTKDPDVDAIIGLAPDLVVVNDEENRYEDAARLLDAGLALHSMSPRTVADVGSAVRALCELVGVVVPGGFGAGQWTAWLEEQLGATTGSFRAGCTFVWRRPWTALGADTYGSSVLELCGLANVFGAEPDRYPQVSLEEVAMLAPEVVVLPSEPYPFGGRHVDEVAGALPGVRPILVDGRDLFWWGIRTPEALPRVRQALAP